MIALDPKRTFPVWLKEDEATPEGERPTLRFRNYTGTEWCDLDDFTNSSDKANPSNPSNETAAGVLRKLAALLGLHLAGWANLRDREGKPLPFTPGASLLDVLHPDELWEIYWSVRNRSRLSVQEKNASASPSPASISDPAAASAPTPAPGPSAA